MPATRQSNALTARKSMAGRSMSTKRGHGLSAASAAVAAVAAALEAIAVAAAVAAAAAAIVVNRAGNAKEEGRSDSGLLLLKAKGKRQKPKGKRSDRKCRSLLRIRTEAPINSTSSLPHFCLLPFAFCLLPCGAAAGLLPLLMKHGFALCLKLGSRFPLREPVGVGDAIADRH